MSPSPNPSRVLSPREYEVLCALGRLGHAKAVGAHLGISPRTVEHHLANARQKLGVETTLQALRLIEVADSGLPRPKRHSGLWVIAAGASAAVAFAAWFVVQSIGRQPVPDLVGLGLTTASQRLEARGLAPVTVYRDVAGRDGRPVRQGTVHSTEPRKGDLVPRGAHVHLVVSTGWFGGSYFQDVGRTELIELFENATLSEQWTVSPGKGRISLTDEPGALSYTLTESTEQGVNPEPVRAHIGFSGRHWVLDFKVRYSIPMGSGRQHKFVVVFGKNSNSKTSLLGWTRATDAANPKSPEAISATLESGGERALALQPKPYGDDRFVVRFVRRASKLTARYSRDGEYFQEFFEATAASDLGNLQWVVITGALFGRDGGKAAYDYIRVTPIDPSLP